LDRYARAVDDLIKQHWILEEDRAELLRRGEKEWDFALQTKSAP